MKRVFSLTRLPAGGGCLNAEAGGNQGRLRASGGGLEGGAFAPRSDGVQRGHRLATLEGRQPPQKCNWAPSPNAHGVLLAVL